MDVKPFGGKELTSRLLVSTLFCMFVWMVGTNESVGLAK